MENRKRPAEPDALDGVVASEIEMLRLFFRSREEEIRKLSSRRLKASALRDELIREIVYAFTQRATYRIIDYQNVLSHLGSANTVRNEINILEEAGLVLKLPDEADRRITYVVSTAKLMDFYRTQMPRLEDNVRLILSVPSRPNK